MDYEDSNTNRQVLSPDTAASRPDRVAERSLTPRTRRAVHRGRHKTDEQVMALDRHAESFSLPTISSFDVLQQQLESLPRTAAQNTDIVEDNCAKDQTPYDCGGKRRDESTQVRGSADTRAGEGVSC
eukprot:5453065-Amphidinium_carterae.1